MNPRPVILSAEARERVELLKTLLERYDDPSSMDDQVFRILLVVNGILDSADYEISQALKGVKAKA